jgi:hypothetical protein
MSPRRWSQPEGFRRAGELDERWQLFIGFWLLAGLALLTIGIAMFAAVAHSHRVAGLVMLLGVVCLAIGGGLLRAARRGE